ncbi:MAG: phosphatase PAP2 family protein [Bacteroidota bacterium]|nr:MAG: phosphatase PAP2 family protein [Bacteroidota bacterium]
MLDKILTLDTNLFLWLNGFHSEAWDKVMWFVSGKTEWIPLYALILAFLIYRYKWKSIPVIIAIVLLITMADQVSSNLIKDNVKRLRPSHVNALKNSIHILNDYRGGPYGFVSSHAANSFALAVFLSLVFRNKWFSAFMVIWAIFVSYSRIYLGVHYPGDILGGALLGALIGWLIYQLLILVQNKLENRKT